MTATCAFELYLLSQMRGESRVASALIASGITKEKMRETAHRMGHEVGFERVGHSIDLYRQTLGAPIETIPEPGMDLIEGFAGSQRYRFHLPVWPDLDFVVRSHPDSWAWGPEFVRRSDASIPATSGPEDLDAWSLIESEVRDRFGPFTSEDVWNRGKDATYVVERSGGRVEISLLFDFALLQSVSVRDQSSGSEAAIADLPEAAANKCEAPMKGKTTK